MNNLITYADSYGNVFTLPIGRDYEVKREENCRDVCISRIVAVDCPLKVALLIRTTGDIVLWYTAWDQPSSNTYWHFSNGSEDLLEGMIDPVTSAVLKAPTPPTQIQKSVLCRMWLGKHAKEPIKLPGGLSTALGRPLIKWAFEGSTTDEINLKYGKGDTIYFAYQ